MTILVLSTWLEKLNRLQNVFHAPTVNSLNPKFSIDVVSSSSHAKSSPGSLAWCICATAPPAESIISRQSSIIRGSPVKSKHNISPEYHIYISHDTSVDFNQFSMKSASSCTSSPILRAIGKLKNEKVLLVSLRLLIVQTLHGQLQNPKSVSWKYCERKYISNYIKRFGIMKTFRYDECKD